MAMKRKQSSLASFLPSQNGTHNTSIDAHNNNNDFGYDNGTTTTSSTGDGNYSSSGRYDDEWKENSFAPSYSSTAAVSASGMHQANDHDHTSIPTISKRRVLPPSMNKTLPPPATKILPSFRPLNSASHNFDPYSSVASTISPTVKKAHRQSEAGAFFKRTLTADGALPPSNGFSGGKRIDGPTYMDEVTLSSSQKKVLDAVMKRRSACFTFIDILTILISYI
jgi:hypothetical protein